MTLHEIVMRLVGPVCALGESNEDTRRLGNLTELTTLVDTLLGEISIASRTADRPEHSMMAIGQHARKFLNEVREQ